MNTCVDRRLGDDSKIVLAHSTPSGMMPQNFRTKGETGLRPCPKYLSEVPQSSYRIALSKKLFSLPAKFFQKIVDIYAGVNILRLAYTPLSVPHFLAHDRSALFRLINFFQGGILHAIR